MIEKVGEGLSCVGNERGGKGCASCGGIGGGDDGVWKRGGEVGLLG